MASDADRCRGRSLGGPREISPRSGQTAGARSGDLRAGEAPRARAHDCRLCQSRRSASAIDQAGRSDLFDEPEPTGLSEAQALALEVVDAFVWRPLRWPRGLGEPVVDALGPTAATELTLDLVRNAANKIAVVFGADDPRVEAGVEYYDIEGRPGIALRRRPRHAGP